MASAGAFFCTPSADTSSLPPFFMTRLIATVLSASLLMPVAAFAASSAPGSVTVDLACIQTAVAAREQSIMTAWGAFNTSMTSAYTTRKSALNTAWGTIDAAARKTAVKSAWDAFRSSKKSAGTQWRTSQKGAWKTFRTASRACKGGASADAGGESADSM